jgi:hypothetical protein
MTTATALRAQQPIAADAEDGPTAPVAPTETLTLRDAVKHYERHVLAWYALGRVEEARAARAAIAFHQAARTGPSMGCALEKRAAPTRGTGPGASVLHL